MNSRERSPLEEELFVGLIDRAREQHAPDWVLKLLVEEFEARQKALAEGPAA